LVLTTTLAKASADSRTQARAGPDSTTVWAAHQGCSLRAGIRIDAGVRIEPAAASDGMTETDSGTATDDADGWASSARMFRSPPQWAQNFWPERGQKQLLSAVWAEHPTHHDLRALCGAVSAARSFRTTRRGNGPEAGRRIEDDPSCVSPSLYRSVGR
jgi:hypothetical protein